MDPKVIAAASEYLATLLNQQPVELQGIAEQLLGNSGMRWIGGTQFQVDQESAATLQTCPALVTDSAISAMILKPYTARAARAELERRLVTAPEVQRYVTTYDGNQGMELGNLDEKSLTNFLSHAQGMSGGLLTSLRGGNHPGPGPDEAA